MRVMNRTVKEKAISFPRQFYARNTVTVAKGLLGAILYRRFADRSVISGPIVEIEAYRQDDPASHAFAGLTERNKVMFGEPGFAYIYFIYGRYFCLNVVTEPPGHGCAILIRAVDIPGGSGPGKLCDTLQIDKQYYGIDMCDPGSAIWIGPGSAVAASDIVQSERIGVSAGRDLAWRFHIKDHAAVSGRRRQKKQNA